MSSVPPALPLNPTQPPLEPAQPRSAFASPALRTLPLPSTRPLLPTCSPLVRNRNPNALTLTSCPASHLCPSHYSPALGPVRLPQLSSISCGQVRHEADHNPRDGSHRHLVHYPAALFPSCFPGGLGPTTNQLIFARGVALFALSVFSDPTQKASRVGACSEFCRRRRPRPVRMLRLLVRQKRQPVSPRG
jgi:hypothetical protein